MIKIKKINRTNINFDVQGQYSSDNCQEHDIWVGRKNSDTIGCIMHDVLISAKEYLWW